MKKASLFLIVGRVQGVGYRFFAQRVASELGLRGYVRNCADGSVEVYAVGTEDELARLRQQLETGPPAGRVERVEEWDAPLKKYNSFSIV